MEDFAMPQVTEQRREYLREYGKKHRAERTASERAWRKAYPERAKANRLAWKAANPGKVKASAKRMNSKKKAWLRGLKAEGCCECGMRDARCLVWHHRVPEEKSFSLGGFRASKADTLAEIDKCDLLCANCHMLRHAEERGESE